MVNMRPLLSCSVLMTFSLLLMLISFHSVSSVAVMSIDLGSEWMKVAVVTPGVPMEIALNPESKRKTAVAVTLKDGERTFGSDAMAKGIKSPKNCYIYLIDLLGKKVDHPLVKQFHERFPYYDIKPHPETGTVMFQHDENTVYTVEELVSMILQHAKQIADDFTQQKVRDAVITVPVYFNQAERRALVTAGELAGLNVLQLISEPMAVALNYGMFRRKEINGTVRHLMFYDMGAQDTTVSIVAFQVVKTKERGFTETHPQAQILGIGYDRSLGGADIQIAVRDFLAEQFNKLGKTKTDVRKVPRAMAKLFKEAARVKTVLSANTQTFAQVENVMEEIDFKLEVTREKLLELNKEHFEMVTDPIKMALETSGMTLNEIHEVILVGAGTRIPKVQEQLSAFLGKELGKNLNTDEAAAMGAVYKAADLSTGFKVKKFITKEAVVFPIDVDFQREYENDDGEKGVKLVKRSLFSRMNPFPQKKIMTFNKHVDDFTFAVNLNDLEFLPPHELTNIGSLNLSLVEVIGVAGAIDKYSNEPNVESKGVKAHFHMDDSGFINVTSVESVFERTITVEQQEAEEKEKELKGEGDKPSSGEKEGKDAAGEAEAIKEGGDSSWSNLGDTISSFFNKENEGKEDGKDKDGKDKKDAKNDKKKKKDDKKKEEVKVPKKPKIEILKEPLEFQTDLVDMPIPSEKLLEESRTKLQALNDHDEAKRQKETALNSLESYVIDVRDKMYQEVYEESVTDEEKEKIMTKCSEISDWIDEEVTPDTELEILETKLREIKDLTTAWLARVREHLERPEALGALNQMLNSTTVFLSKANNNSGDDGLFTMVELEMLEKKVEEVAKWKKEQELEQEKQPKNEMPKMTTGLIAEKALDLDREVKYLVNKAKIARADKEREKKKAEEEAKKAKEAEEKEKKKKKKKKKAASSNDTSNTAEEEELKSGDAQEEDAKVVDETPVDENEPKVEDEDQDQEEDGRQEEEVEEEKGEAAEEKVEEKLEEEDEEEEEIADEDDEVKKDSHTEL